MHTHDWRNDFNIPGCSQSMQLLLICLRLDNDLQEQANLHAAAPADWQAAVQHAIEHGIAPLLYQRLKADNLIRLLPADAQRRLTEVYQRTVLQNVRIFQSLEEILAPFNQSAIPVILLKGIYLAEKIYANIGLRPMTDIDLLVPRQQLGQALAVLQSLDYQPPYTFQVEKEAHQAHALPPLDKAGGSPIDLHWTLLPPATPFTIPLEQIWQDSHPAVSQGAEIRELAPEDLLLHLCLHAVYLDRFASGLRPFCDIAWTVKTLQNLPDSPGSIDWLRFCQRAGQWGASRSAWLALMLAVRLFGAPVPVAAIEDLHQPAPDDLSRVDWAVAQVLQPAATGGKLAAVWAPNPWPRRAALFTRLLLPSPHEMRFAYPRLARNLTWPLAYLRHLGLVMRRNWRSAWSLARGEASAREAARLRDRINQLVKWQESRQK
jgi:hypothetical protein